MGVGISAVLCTTRKSKYGEDEVIEMDLKPLMPGLVVKGWGRHWEGIGFESYWGQRMRKKRGLVLFYVPLEIQNMGRMR